MEENIRDFVKGITKGPFRLLNNCEGEYLSQKIVDSNRDIYTHAVYQAYLDMCRTMPGVGKIKKKMDEALAMMARDIKIYFEGKPKTSDDGFDDWHRSICSKFETSTGCTVGQSQKVLNMAFKYLYCCSDIRNEKSSHFEKCHMPLDAYTLKWYKKICNKNYNGELWSRINDIEMYYDMQAMIRKNLYSQNVLSAEFVIWQTEKEDIENDKLIGCVNSIIKSDRCSKELKQLLEEYKKSLNKKKETTAFKD